jgi:hypothetical protein
VRKATTLTIAKGTNKDLGCEVLNRGHADPPSHIAMHGRAVTLIKAGERSGLCERAAHQPIVIDCLLHDLYVVDLARKVRGSAQVGEPASIRSSPAMIDCAGVAVAQLSMAADYPDSMTPQHGSPDERYSPARAILRRQQLAVDLTHPVELLSSVCERFLEFEHPHLLLLQLGAQLVDQSSRGPVKSGRSGGGNPRIVAHTTAGVGLLAVAGCGLARVSGGSGRLNRERERRVHAGSTGRVSAVPHW